MRVCLYGYGLQILGSGAARFALDLAKELTRRGCEVTIATKTQSNEPEVLEGARYQPIASGQRLSANADMSFLAASAITFLRLRGRYDLIHSMSGWPRFALAARVAGWCAGVPVVHSILSPAPHTRWYRGFAKVICTSRSGWLGLANAAYIPPFIDLQRFQEKATSTLSRARPVTIGTLGPPLPRKGVRVLLQAIPLIRHHFENLHFALAIEPPQVTHDARLRAELEWVRAFIRQEGLEEKVTLHGAVDVPSFLQSLDIFVFPIQSVAGMIDPPITVLEAMASRCSILASRVGAIEEVLADGVNGLLVDYEHRGDPSSYSQRLSDLIQDVELRERLGAKAREDATRYDVTTVSDAFLDVYAGALNARKYNHGR